MADELTITQILAYADGELPAEQARQVEAHLARNPAVRRLIEADGKLRAQLAHVMQPTPAASEMTAMADRIRAAAVGRIDQPTVNEVRVARAATASSAAPGESSLSLLDRIAGFFSGSAHRPRQVSFLSATAVIVLITAIVLIGIFGQPLDHYEGGAPIPGSLLTEAAEHVSKEHDRCAGCYDAMMEKVVAVTEEEAISHLQAHLGVELVTIFNLTDLGYRFVGYGPCAMPGARTSAHLIYAREVPDEQPSTLSIFIVPNEGQYARECRGRRKSDGRWSGICGGPGCGKSILHGSDDSLVYFIACRHADLVDAVSREICQSLRRRGQ
jgi:hypothetical protein